VCVCVCASVYGVFTSKRGRNKAIWASSTGGRLPIWDKGEETYSKRASGDEDYQF
jgi:hypothetical protein